jgi:hypothetical protein
MKERPILFNGEMVKAILDGRKTQTRRPVKPQPGPLGIHPAMRRQMVEKPLGTIGDQLYVRETFSLKDSSHEDSPNVVYRADQDSDRMVWTPSIHMPRWASRITLEITGVRVERLQEITEEDAEREGVESVKYGSETFWKAHGKNLLPEGGELVVTRTAAQSFRTLWQSIYGNWHANPWVWVYEFRKM